MNQLVKQNGNGADMVERVVMQGDLSKLTPQERVQYYGDVCKSLGLNPLTKPFEYITLNGKLTLYARKDATEQLRMNRGISIKIASREIVEDCYVVTAQATDKTGRSDESIGAVNIGGLKGEVRANAMMKAETKAKRRVTLSISGLGMLDELEVETIPNAQPQGRGNPLRQEFAALSYELDGCKSKEQVDLLLNSPEYAEFKQRDAEQAARGGVGFADHIEDKADAMKKKLPDKIEDRRTYVKTVDEYPNGGASSPDAAPEVSSVPPPAPSPAEEILPEYSQLVQGFFDRIDLAETADELKAVSGDIVAKQTELAEADKKALSNAWKQRKRTIAEKAA